MRGTGEQQSALMLPEPRMLEYFLVLFSELEQAYTRVRERGSTFMFLSWNCGKHGT